MLEKINIKKFTKLLPIIGIILLIYLIIDINVEKIAETFLLIPIHLYLFSIILVIPKILTYTYKWQYLSSKQKMYFSIPYLIKIFLIGLFYGSVTPGAIGWHIRIYYLKNKSKASIEKCIVNSLLDSATGIISGNFLALIGTIILIRYIPGFFTIILLFFIFYLTVIVVLMQKRSGNKIVNLILRPLIPNKYKTSLDHSLDALYEDIPKIRHLLVPFILECIVWIIAATQVYILAQAFSINIPYIIFILTSIVSVVIANVLPISISGLGVREGVFVVLLSNFGIQPEIAFVISFSGFLVKILFPGIIGGILSIKEHKYKY